VYFYVSKLINDDFKLMKRVLILIYVLMSSVALRAETPVQELIAQYEDVKGIRILVAKGAMMSVVRPMLKSYTIAPMADYVEELSALRIGRGIDADEKEKFLTALSEALKSYMYVGKTKSTSGVVDAYVHLLSDEVVDELVVFNPKTKALNTLLGEFPVSELETLKNEDF